LKQPKRKGSAMLEIKLARNDGFEQIWPVIHEVLCAGDTYPFAPDTTQAEAFHIWMKNEHTGNFF
jgi:hypothetical protein